MAPHMQLQACGHPMLVAWAGLGANWCCKHQGHLQTCQGPVVHVGPRCWPQRWWHGDKPRALACCQWAGHAPTRQKPSRADNARTTGCTLRLAPLSPMVRGCTSLQPKPTHGCCGGHCQGTAGSGPTGSRAVGLPAPAETSISIFGKHLAIWWQMHGKRFEKTLHLATIARNRHQLLPKMETWWHQIAT